MRTRRLVSGAAISAGGLALGVCSGALASTPAEPTGDPFVIASVLTRSGPAASFFEPAAATLETAVEFVNENGGIAGRPVDLEFIDSAGDPAKAISELTSYLDGNTPDMVFAGAVSTESEPILPVLSQQEIFSTASTVAQQLNNPEEFPFHFPAPPSTDQVSTAMADYLAEDGHTKVAFLGPDNVSGQSVLAALETAADERDMEVVSALVDPTATDATGQLTSLQDEEPDVLVLSGYGPFSAVFLRSLSRIGWDVPVVADETFSAQNLGESAPADLLVAMTLQFFPFGIAGDPAAATPAVEAMTSALSDRGLATAAAWAQAVGPWNSVMLAKIAGDAAGADADGPALAEALEGITELPDDMTGMFIGAPKFGLSADNHTPLWSADDFVYVPGGPLDEFGLLVSAAGEETDATEASATTAA